MKVLGSSEKKYVLLPGCWLQLDANHFQLAKQPFGFVGFLKHGH